MSNSAATTATGPTAPSAVPTTVSWWTFRADPQFPAMPFVPVTSRTIEASTVLLRQSPEFLIVSPVDRASATRHFQRVWCNQLRSTVHTDDDWHKWRKRFPTTAAAKQEQQPPYTKTTSSGFHVPFRWSDQHEASVLQWIEHDAMFPIQYPGSGHVMRGWGIWKMLCWFPRVTANPNCLWFLNPKTHVYELVTLGPIAANQILTVPATVMWEHLLCVKPLRPNDHGHVRVARSLLSGQAPWSYIQVLHQLVVEQAESIQRRALALYACPSET
ncbi:MAG TPA: hypothetical protein VM260_04120, partial [Pirellula sp.]|nr:hypothetical protein [Pirellula sp.]